MRAAAYQKSLLTLSTHSRRCKERKAAVGCERREFGNGRSQRKIHIIRLDGSSAAATVVRVKTQDSHFRPYPDGQVFHP